MKTLIAATLFLLGMSISSINPAAAQLKKTMDVQSIINDLQQTSVQNGLINLGNVSVNINNITVKDLVTVNRVLNNADIRVLNNAINNNDILKNISVDLTNVLRDARILNKNQIIVGVLSRQDALQFITQNANTM